MMPVYRYMDSYPLHGNQMPSSQYYHPSFEVLPHFVKDDPSKSIMNQPWPYANNVGCSVPFHPCCSHGNFPGCYGFAPCPHFSSPQFHHCGYHPPFPDSFPVHYVPNYLREQPRYEFDKPRDNDYRCCGCPNHTHNPRNGGSMRIEEQVPDVQNKAGDSFVPFQLKNCPYPVLWFPSEYIKNKEHKKPLESDTASRENFAQDKKPSEDVKPSEQNRRVWSSWFPVDMKGLRSLMHGDDRGSIQDQENEDIEGQSPFPIFWMPYKHDEAVKEEHGEMNVAPKSVKEPASTEKFFSVKLPSSVDSMNKSQVVHESSDGQVNSEIKEKSNNQRSIPVKQIEAPREKYDTEDAERRQSDASLKNAEDNRMVKASGPSTKRQSSSSPKASKLPPVCLRVDPLPRKKNGNTSSRSPSPPGFKSQSHETTDNTPKASVSSNLKANDYQNSLVQDSTSSSSKVVEPKPNKDKVVEAVETTLRQPGHHPSENKDEEQRSGYQYQFTTASSIDPKKEASNSLTMEKSEKNEDNCIIKEEADEQVNETKETINSSISGDGELKAEKKKLSDEEAALRIQSAFRGFEVRKWEPLKKLKQIARIQEQLIHIRNKICHLESSHDLQKDEKQRIIIGEMIMSLLLKLDTIQGLHPSLRDIRKSLAGELVTLQEKLDLLAKAKSSENPPINPDNIVGIEGGQNKDAEERQNHYVCQPMDVAFDTQGMETSKPLLVDKEEQRKFENGAVPVAGDLESHLEEPENNAGNREFHSSNALIMENHVPSDIEQGCQLSLEKSGSEEKAGAQLENIWCNTNSEGWSELVQVNESMQRDDDQVNKAEILPEGVTVKEPTAAAEEEQTGTNVIWPRQNKVVESNIRSDSDSPAAIVDKLTISKEIPEINLLKELPVGVIYDEEPEEHGRSEIQDSEVLPGGDVEREATIDALEQKPTESYEEGQVNIDASSLDDGVSGLNELEHQPVEVLNEGVTATEAALLPDSEVPTQCESKQQPVEGFNGGVFDAERNDWVKIASQKDDFLGKEMPEGDMQETQALQVNKDNDQVEESQSEETQAASSLLQRQSHDGVQKEVDQGIVNINSSSISEVPTTMIITEVKEPKIGEDQDNVDQPKAGNLDEDIIKEENKHLELEMVSGYDKMANQPKEMETSERESVVGAQVTPVLTEQEEKRESSPLSSASNQQSMNEQEMEMEVDRKLIEENEKMRLMVEKLIEAGKEQSAVISNLTGRVKDLEKKLSKRKKMKARRWRTAISPPSGATRSSPSPRKRAVGVAM